MTMQVNSFRPALKRPREELLAKEELLVESSTTHSKIGLAIVQQKSQEALRLIQDGSPFAWIERGFHLISLAILNVSDQELIKTLVDKANALILNTRCYHDDTPLRTYPPILNICFLRLFCHISRPLLGLLKKYGLRSNLEI